MAFDPIPVPVRGSATFNADAEAFAQGMSQFATDYNALSSVIDGALTSTSTTSLTIGTGSKVLTVQAGLGYVVGYPLRISSSASPTNYMDGIVTAYNTGTGSLTVNVLSVSGSGTIAAWNTMVLPGGGNFAGLTYNKFTQRQVFANEVSIASASTIDFTAGNSNQFLITGTTSITAVTIEQGAVVKARFAAACTLTHGTNLQVQGGANYTTIAGDIATFTSNGTVVRVEIARADGKPIIPTTPLNATSDSTFSSTSGSDVVSPGWVIGKFGNIRHGRTTESSGYTPAGGENLTMAHGLSVVPSSFRIVLKCLVADANYSVGDKVCPGSYWNGSTAAPLTFYADTTNCGCKMPSGYSLNILNKTTGAGQTPTAGSWSYYFEFTY